MKHLPLITLLLWLLLIMGSIVYPELFLKEYVQYPLVIVLSVFLPASFWLKIKGKKKIFALGYVIVFLINIVFLMLAVEQNFTTQKNLGGSTKRGIVPEIAELLSQTKDIERSRLAARFIYQNHAVAVPYRVSDSSFQLFAPSRDDKESYKANAAKSTHSEVVMMNATGQMLSALFLLVLHVGIFMIVLVFLTIYEE